MTELRAEMVKLTGQAGGAEQLTRDVR
jgi:hypothetical protein